MYLKEMIKLALRDYPPVESPQYENIVDRTVRMPGPTESKRKFFNTSVFPTEQSKSMAQSMLKDTKRETVKTHTIEGIN